MKTHNKIPDDFEAQVQSKIDFKTKPLGALGALEPLAAQIAKLQATLSPVMETCELTIFAGDHGMATAGVSAFPQEVTRQMVLNFLEGGAAANVFARTLDVALKVVNAGVAGEPISHPNLIFKSVADGTQNAIEGAAMSEAQCEQALDYGKEIGLNATTDAVCYGEMGIGNTSSATLLAHKILGLPLSEITGAGTGLDSDGISRKLGLLQKAAKRTAPTLPVMATLREYGGFEIVMMAGAMIGAGRAGKLVLVDGFIATAAALAAQKIDPSIKDALVYAHMSDEHGHKAVLDALGATPLLNMGLRLGEGTGSLLAWPLVKSACAMLNDMASFESADVSGAN